MSRVRASRVENGVTLWRCSKCGKYLPGSDFHRKSRSPTGLVSRCRGCCSEDERVAHGLTTPKTWGVGLPRRGSEWVAEASADEGPGKCVVGGELLPPGRRVLCGSVECARVYRNLHRQEIRTKAKARRALDTPLTSGAK